MRTTLSAMVVAAGLLGFGAAAHAAPAPAALPGIATEAPLVQVQMSPRERRMMRRHRMERRMMHRHRMERRMHHRRMMHHRRHMHRM